MDEIEERKERFPWKRPADIEAGVTSCGAREAVNGKKVE
jgi:hypothetical protein